MEGCLLLYTFQHVLYYKIWHCSVGPTHHVTDRSLMNFWPGKMRKHSTLKRIYWTVKSEWHVRDKFPQLTQVSHRLAAKCQWESESSQVRLSSHKQMRKFTTLAALCRCRSDLGPPHRQCCFNQFQNDSIQVRVFTNLTQVMTRVMGLLWSLFGSNMSLAFTRSNRFTNFRSNTTIMQLMLKLAVRLRHRLCYIEQQSKLTRSTRLFRCLGLC